MSEQDIESRITGKMGKKLQPFPKKRLVYDMVYEFMTDESDDRLIIMKGIRKVGKTVILEQFAESTDNALYLDASKQEDIELIEEYTSVIKNLIEDGIIKYLIIDEAGYIDSLGRIKELYESCYLNFAKCIITASANMYLWKVRDFVYSERCIMVTIPDFIFAEKLYFDGYIDRDVMYKSIDELWNLMGATTKEQRRQVNKLFIDYSIYGSDIARFESIVHGEDEYIERMIYNRLGNGNELVTNKLFGFIGSERRGTNEDIDNYYVEKYTNKILRSILYIAYKCADKVQRNSLTYVNYATERHGLKEGVLKVADKEVRERIDNFIIKRIEESTTAASDEDIFWVVNILLKSSMAYIEYDSRAGLDDAEQRVEFAINQIRGLEYKSQTGVGAEAFFKDWNVCIMDTAIYGIILRDVMSEMGLNGEADRVFGGTIKGRIVEVAIKSQMCRFMNIPSIAKKSEVPGFVKNINKKTDGEVDSVVKLQNGDVLGCEVTIRNKGDSEVHLGKGDEFTIRMATDDAVWSDNENVRHMPFGFAAVILGLIGYRDNLEKIRKNKVVYKGTTQVKAWNDARMTHEIEEGSQGNEKDRRL